MANTSDSTNHPRPGMNTQATPSSQAPHVSATRLKPGSIKPVNGLPRNTNQPQKHAITGSQMPPTQPETTWWSRFQTSKRAGVVDDIFRTSFERALRASFAWHSKLCDIKIHIVPATDSQFNHYFNEDQRTLNISEKCIDFRRLHASGGCDVLQLTQGKSLGEEEFSCDHVVEDMFENYVFAIDHKRSLNPYEFYALRQGVRERVRNIPRSVKVYTTRLANQLVVSWTGNESEIISKQYGESILYHVTLHKISTCRSRMGDLVHQNDVSIESHKPCACASQVVSRIASKAIFSGLDHKELYFPMVARNQKQAFFGVPPSPIAPAAVSVTLPAIIDATNSSEHQLLPNGQAMVEDELRLQPLANDGAHNKERADIQIHPKYDPTSAVTPSQRQNSAADGVACRHDEKTWKDWHKLELPVVFSQLTPKRNMECSQPTSSGSSFPCSRLKYTFKRGEYSFIRSNSEPTFGSVILIHDIQCVNDDSYYLLATRYSFLRSAHPFCSLSPSTSNDVGISSKELLLHFEEFKKMGTIGDAETIRLDDITHAENLTSVSNFSSDSVEHLLQIPPDIENCGLYCRFAVTGSAPDNAACFSPLASSFFKHANRWRQPTFIYPPKPLVFDLTTNVLGPSEGFSKEGYTIHSGIGFNHERHLTWKVRHSTSEVYDGSPLNVFDELSSGELAPLCLRPPEHPRIALVAGESQPFRLSETNEALPPLADFLKPLDIIEVAQSPLNPNFTVLIMPSALLHCSAIGRFSSSILKLLERRLSVHIKLCQLQDYGIPQDRSVLLVIASPLCDSLPWAIDRPKADVPPSVTVKEIIGDLTFENTRAKQSDRGGFACSVPQKNPTDGDEKERLNRPIYNHQTGHTSRIGKTIHLDEKTAALSFTTPLIHPIRQDVLTIRELARLQGFKDDFVFYHPIELQYVDVLNAVPPVIAELAAKILLRVVHGSRRIELKSREQTPRANKRARVDSDDQNADLVGFEKERSL